MPARQTDSFYPYEPVWKTPGELVNFDFEFTDDIPTSDSIKAKGDSSATGAVAYDEDSLVVTNTLIMATIVTGTKVRVRLMGGTADANYTIVATAEMATSGEKVQQGLKVKVRAVPVI